MVANTLKQEVSPLKTISNPTKRLDVYPDRLVIRRTDLLAALIGVEKVIYLDEISRTHLYTSRFLNKRLQLAIVTHDNKSIAIGFNQEQHDEVKRVQELIEDLLVKRDFMPSLRV